MRLRTAKKIKKQHDLFWYGWAIVLGGQPESSNYKYVRKAKRLFYKNRHFGSEKKFSKYNMRIQKSSMIWGRWYNKFHSMCS